MTEVLRHGARALLAQAWVRGGWAHLAGPRAAKCLI